MTADAASEASADAPTIVELLELERLSAEVAVLRDCVASLAKERDDTACRFDVEDHSDRK